MMDPEKDQTEAEELKKFYSHYLDKINKIMKNTHSKVEGFFGDVTSKVNFSPEHINKLNNFLIKLL